MVSIVSHLNRGSECLQSADERLALAHMNLQVGQAAIRSLSYEGALFFFENALKLLPEDSWRTHHALTLRLHLENMRTLSLTHAPDTTQNTFAALLTHSDTLEERAEVRLFVFFLSSSPLPHSPLIIRT